MADAVLILLGILVSIAAFPAIGIAIAYYILQRNPATREGAFCRVVGKLGSVAGRLLIVGIIAVLAGGTAYEYRAKLTHDAIGFLIIVVGVLSETWQFWVIVVAGALWAWSHRRNRQRQQAIIELLLEIRKKLE